MFGFKNKFGLSFSLKRLFGLSGLRNSVAHRVGVPITRGGLERKAGRWLIRLLLGRKW